MKSKRGDAEGHGWCVCLRERELLSRIVGDPTFGSRREEKESCSTKRRKAALRREAHAWVPDLRSLDKLREVGVLSYLGFTLYLSVL